MGGAGAGASDGRVDPRRRAGELAAMSVGWKLEGEAREALLAAVPPRWPVPIADHVTLPGTLDLPPPAAIVIVGEADDGAGVQALVVTVNGTSERPDGGTFHITWSLDRARGRRAVESNAVIARFGWRPLGPLPVATAPARWTWIDP